ncbi:alpha/beta-hydrolase [Cytidiella melzeri]|nr:alpha/beta-hydrolase [Cytidiella melzeri]
MTRFLCLFRALALLSLTGTVCSQTSRSVPNSFPQDYPGKPTGDFSPEWQNYFLVKNGSLPNVTFTLSRNWAGNIPVNRTNHPNDTLFFWAFEHTDGSLTQNASSSSDEPWAIWLNGGPGASSMLGLLLENGPLHVDDGGAIIPNNVSWDKMVDYVWVDQPVGTGFSTAEATGGYIQDEDQMGEDFLNFLRNLVKIFPSLATRPLLLTGESYAGTYIPYITKTIFSTPEPPVNLTKIAIGNGAMGAEPEYEVLPAFSLIETYPQLIGYDPEVYQYFKVQNHLCGYDFNLTYPQNGKFPRVLSPQRPSDGARAAQLINQQPALVRKRLTALAHSVEAPEVGIVRRESLPSLEEIERREIKRQSWLASKRSVLQNRDLSGRANGTIDPWYGCFLSNEVQDYALNFSMPWNLSVEIVVPSLDDYGPYNVYNLEDARAPPLAIDPSEFMNDNRTRAALHAPTSKNWTLQINYPFNSSLRGSPGANPFGDPSVEAVAFFDELASNATEHGVKVIIYLGNDDTVVPHISSEITIQNTTFGGIQGFSKKPSTPWFDDSGNFAGIVHQERNWTYILVAKAGHEVPEYQPEAAWVMFREFILGNNQTGLLTNSSTTAIGGEDPSLLIGPNNILPGESAILYGSGTATSLFMAPSATIAAWNSFFASVATANQSLSSATGSSSAGAANQTGGAGGAGGNSSSAGLSVTFGGATDWKMPVWCSALVVAIVLGGGTPM